MAHIQPEGRVTAVKGFFSRLLTPSPLEDHELAQVGVALHILVCVGACIPVLLALAMPAWYLNRAIVLEIVSIGVAVPVIMATRRGHVLGAGGAAIAMMWLILTFASATNMGIYNPAFTGYIILIAAAGLLLGRRAAYGLAILSVVSGFMLQALDANGVTAHRIYTPAAVWAFNGIYFVMAAGLLSLAYSRVTSASDVARRAAAERVETEAQLRDSEERFRRLAEAAHEGIVFTEGGVVVDISRQAAATLGYQVAEMIGRPVSDFVAPESLELVKAHMRAGSEEPYEHGLVRKDGTRLVAEARARTVPFEGRQVRVTVLRDVTEEKRAAEERLRLVSAIEQAGEIIIITDPKGQVQYANRAIESICGYRSADVIGLPILSLLGASTDDPTYQDLRQHALNLMPWAGRIRCKRMDGAAYTADITMSPVRSASGEVVAVVGVGRDISDELVTEEQLRQAQRMETVGQLAGGVAHDFNNLMSPILGHAEMMLEDLPLGHPFREQLDTIRAAAERARQLTQQLLAFGRKQVIRVEPVDLAQVVADFQAILRRTIREDIEIDVRLSAASSIVEADARQLEQVLMNLVVNAQDAMPHGGRLLIETAVITAPDDSGALADLPAGSYVRLTVGDSGSGIHPDVLPRIFEPFFTTKEKGRGTGLGLSTVYGIIAQQKGHVRVESAPGEGTRFFVFLPRLDRQELAADRRAAAAAGGTGTETVIVAEDDDMVRTLVVSALRLRGYRIIEVAQPEQCLDIVEAQNTTPDLLLTDVVMPKLNGRDLHKLLAGRFPAMKVLFMSGYLNDVIGTHGVLDDGLNYIQKPFSVAALAEQVRHVLDR